MTSYAARRLPVHRGPAAWSAILPGQPDPVPLTEDRTADIVIVGAGFAGLSAAHRLRQIDPTLQIAVVEAGRLAEGAAGRNSGFMIDLPHELQSDDYSGGGDDRAVIARNRHAIAFARDAVAEYGIDANFFDPAGKVNGAASDTADALNRSYARHLAGMGEASEIIDAQGMTALTGSRHYQSGLYTPGTVMLQPAGYVRGLGHGLRQRGVAIYENTPVTGLRQSGAGWTIATPGGRISAASAILATNGQIESFGFATGRLMHVFLYASMTVELSDTDLAKLGGQPRWGITPSDPMGTTMRRIDSGQGGNRIVTRTCSTFEPGMEASAANLRRTAQVHRRKFDERFPRLKGVRMEYSWAGHLCLTRNGVAVARELDRNLFSACVQNGLGTARGTLTGITAADMALGVDSDIARHFAAEPEPKRLPPPPFSTIGANLFLRWKEWRAAQE